MNKEIEAIFNSLNKGNEEGILSVPHDLQIENTLELLEDRAVICVLDTETTDINKTFCYNVGYVLFDTANNEILLAEDFVVKQIWENIPLFSTAYYAEKRPIYINRMRGRTAQMKKWGHITQHMSHIFEAYEVKAVFAYNSPFDTRVFEFMSDFYKTINPLDTLPIYDIRGHVMEVIAFTQDFRDFCEENELFTESGNYSTTAETLTRYLTKNLDFEEEHTALADSIIELMILKRCVSLGAEWCETYKVPMTVPRPTKKYFILKDKIEGNEIHRNYYKIRISKKDRDKGTTVTLS